jgi:hypothetical protein
VTTPIETLAKTTLGMVLVFEDITEHNRVQDAMRESEARFRAIFESTVIGIMLLDLNGSIPLTARRSTRSAPSRASMKSSAGSPAGSANAVPDTCSRPIRFGLALTSIRSSTSS